MTTRLPFAVGWLCTHHSPVATPHVGHALRAESELITKALLRVPGLESLSEQTAKRLSAVEHYTKAHRQYCWQVGSLADLRLAPFHILASEGTVHADKPDTWHMKTNALPTSPHPRRRLLDRKRSCAKLTS
jgi:protein phosphatase